MRPEREIINGFVLHRDALDRAAQEAMVQDCRAVIRAAPLVQPLLPGMTTMSNRAG